MENTGEVVLMAIMKCLPYPEQIVDLQIKPNAIYFTWRQDRFKVEFPLIMVSTVDGCMLTGCNTSLLLRQLIQRQLKSEL